jgi:hypothetical protein
MELYPRVKLALPVTASNGREYLDVVTGLTPGQGPDPALVSEITRWATSYRDKHYPGRELRFDWETGWGLSPCDGPERA